MSENTEKNTFPWRYLGEVLFSLVISMVGSVELAKSTHGVATWSEALQAFDNNDVFSFFSCLAIALIITLCIEILYANGSLSRIDRKLNTSSNELDSKLSAAIKLCSQTSGDVSEIKVNTPKCYTEVNVAVFRKFLSYAPLYVGQDLGFLRRKGCAS